MAHYSDTDTGDGRSRAASYARRGARSQRGVRKGRDLESLSEEEQLHRARDIVYRQLGMMDRSRYQLSQALHTRQVPEVVAERVLHEFEVAGYIDDAKFARVLTAVRRRDKNASRRAIAAELRRKGVAADLIEETLAEISPDAELDSAVQLAVKKLRSASGKPETLAQRTYAMLARRGFTAEQCAQALRQARALLLDEGTAEETGDDGYDYAAEGTVAE
ncbi:regulatory protein RecX [Actinotignum sanguinis]|nr:regulatory protein RecX [Actinotignum sanguinis]MDE1641717.1 regulatory protein RecX [Actinotignum sanguinis]